MTEHSNHLQSLLEPKDESNARAQLPNRVNYILAFLIRTTPSAAPLDYWRDLPCFHTAFTYSLYGDCIHITQNIQYAPLIHRFGTRTKHIPGASHADKSLHFSRIQRWGRFVGWLLLLLLWLLLGKHTTHTMPQILCSVVWASIKASTRTRRPDAYLAHRRGLLRIASHIYHILAHAAEGCPMECKPSLSFVLLQKALLLRWTILRLSMRS